MYNYVPVSTMEKMVREGELIQVGNKESYDEI